jgi:hypothetical protein
MADQGDASGAEQARQKRPIPACFGLHKLCTAAVDNIVGNRILIAQKPRRCGLMVCLPQN